MKLVRYGWSALGLLGLPMLGGCPARVDEIRGQADVARDFTTSRKIDDVLGCISDGWTGIGDYLPTTNKTSTGWTVVYRVGDWNHRVVDLKSAGGKTLVSYRSNFGKMSEKLLPPVQACL